MISLSKPFAKVGNWAQQNLTVLQNFAKSLKDVVVKGKKDIPVEFGARTKLFLPQHNFFKQCVPHLQNYQSCLIRNARKIGIQMSQRNCISSNPFFRGDILWRQARKGHLIAFAGLFLFQEENATANNQLHNEYRLYERVCQNIKEIFPAFEKTKQLRDEFGHNLEDFMFENCATNHNENLVYNVGVGEPNEVGFSVCNEDSSFPSSWDVIRSENQNSLSANCKNFAVKVVLPKKGVRRIETVLRDSECELKCGGVVANLKSSFSPELKNGSTSTQILPHHPNILAIERAFCDDILDVNVNGPSSVESPHVDKALYIVTKRYNTTLRTRIEQGWQSPEESALLLIQLLEAVAHLESNHVAHRNITADNVFLEYDEDGISRVVLGGFEHAYFAPSRKDLKVPFQHSALDTRVGEMSTQAPELSTASPGRFRNFDYTKSDAWSVGAIAYYIMTGHHPFEGKVLDSCTYKDEDLPSLDNVRVPIVLKIISEMLLARDPSKRLSASEAADILHFELFALPPYKSECDDVEKLRYWLVTHCAEALARKRSGSVLFQICQNFFRRFESRKLFANFRLWMKVRCAANFYG